MVGSHERQREKPNQLKEQKVKSLEFLKPTLATTLAIVLAWLLSVRPAQAGYTVTLQQVGPNVVATGSGAIDLTGLTFNSSASLNPLFGHFFGLPARRGCRISTGPTSSSVDSYVGGLSGPTSFGSGGAPASSGSGDMVGINAVSSFEFTGVLLSVPRGYVSGTALSDSATYSDASLAALGVRPGTYVWKWGTGANQNFTLQIKTPGPASTSIWYLNNNAFVARTGAPTLPVGWGVVGVADFNGDSKPDYILYTPATRQTGVWYLNNNAFVGGAYGPTLPVNWKVVGVADFNGDNKPDYLLFNSSTGQTAIWYLSGPTFVAGAFGPTIVSGYTLIGAADFDRDGKPDYALYRSAMQRTD